MDTPHPKEATKATASKHAESSASDGGNDGKGYESSSSSKSEDINFRGFSEEEIKTLDAMLAKRVGKAIKKSMPYYIKKTTQNLRGLMQEEFKEFKKECGFTKEPKGDKATYRDFTACDVPKFTGFLIRLLAIDGLPRLKVLFVQVVVKKERKSSTLLILFAIVLRLGGKERFMKRVKFWLRHVHGRSSRSCLVRNMLQLKKLIKFGKSFNLLCKPMRR